MDTRSLWTNTARILRQRSAGTRYPRINHRKASTSTSGPKAQTPSAQSTGSKIAKDDTLARSATTKAKPAPPKAPNWPWRTIESDAATGRASEERLIYSRPPSFRPKMLWFVIAAWIPASVLMADNLVRGYENEEFEAKQQAALQAAASTTPTAVQNTAAAATSSATASKARVSEDPHPDLAVEPKSVHTSAKTNTLVPFVTNGQLAATAIVLAGSFMTFVSLAYPTRVITRLAQVRSRASSQDPWKYLIKMETASNQMWAGSWKRARLIDPSRMQVGLIRRGEAESPFLRVKVQPSREDRVIGDNYTYRLDFTKLQKGDHGVPDKTSPLTDVAGKSSTSAAKPRPWQEVVVSLRRIEEVFGAL